MWMPDTADLPRLVSPAQISVGRDTAAELLEISPSLFDRLVEEGELPQPVQPGKHRRKLWLVDELRTAAKRWRDTEADEWAAV
jgi:predicted DNA-binding transcriptional regulator AlpA